MARCYKAAMAKQPKQDDPKQSQRFIETAKEIGVDEKPEAFDRAFKKVAPLGQKPKGA